MIATLQKSEGSLWHTQGLHFDDLGTKAIILSFSTIKRLYGQNRRIVGGKKLLSGKSIV